MKLKAIVVRSFVRSFGGDEPSVDVVDQQTDRQITSPHAFKNIYTLI